MSDPQEQEGVSPATNNTRADRVEAVVVEEVNESGGLDELRETWAELLSASPSDTIFLTWEWERTWWRCLAKRGVPRILVVRRGGRLVGIAPLVLVPPRPLRLLPFHTIEFAGTGAIGPDYLDVIVGCGEETVVVKALGEQLSSSRYVIVLDQVAAGHCPASRLTQSLESKGWTIVSRAVGICPRIDLSGHSWESYLAGLGASHRQNVRRRLRKIHEVFDVDLIEATTETQRQECLRDFELLHNRRWVSRGGSEALTGSEVMLFHDEFSRLALKRGWLRLYVLRLDGKPAACIYGFVYSGVFYFYQSGFNPDFARYSVGLVAMALSIQKAISDGVRYYDMLHGEERYKYLWANGQRNLVAYDCYPPTLHGALACRVVKLRTDIKRILGKQAAAARTAFCFDAAVGRGHR